MITRRFHPWSKTIQFLERIVEIPLPCIPRSKLCPTAAITNAFRFTTEASAFNSQAFNWVDQKQLVKIFTYGALLCVHPANSSYVPWFRPQAVCWELFSQGWGVLCVYQAGVPIKLIKARGNWLSDIILIIKQCL